ncbi:MAG: MFS transporter [Anaerolineaceae bacterium]|nr:MFS transporter [Anaerolineaceae bacterium]
MGAIEDQKIDYRLKWLVLTSVGMGIFLGTIDSSIVNIALPTMTRQFQANFATVQWVVLAYLLTITTLMLGVSRLADIKGKKPIYITGFVIFTIGSLLCGLSHTISMLIVSRVLQGIGGTMITSLGMAIITESFPPSERGRALGLTSTIVSLGIVLGPTLGGVIIEHLSWNWIFFVNLPVGIVGIIMVMRFVPDIRPKGKQRFDFPGAIILFICLLTFLLALTLGQRLGFTNQTVLFISIICILSLVVFIITELRTQQPMIELRLFRDRFFSINLITRIITFISIAGTLVLMPFYLENMLGYHTQQVGLMMAIVPIAVGIIGPISGTLSDRFGNRLISVIGLATLVIGYVLVSTLSAETSISGYLMRFFPIGLGMGIFQSPNNNAVMGSATRERLGIMSGILAISRTLGQTSGIAILGTIWASRTFYYAGEVLAAGATEAPITAQIAGLHDTFTGIIVIISIALGLALWALADEYRSRKHRPEAHKNTN